MWTAPALALGLLLCACQPGDRQEPSRAAVETAPAGVTPVPENRPAPITTQAWLMATASVTDLDRSARFFTEIGGYEVVSRGPLLPSEITALGLPDGATGEALVLAAPDSAHGHVRLVRFDNAGRKVPTRPGARAWDTGCYWSLMVRARDMQAIYDDAIALGWWTQTPITDLEFGTSKLKVVVFQGPDGMQVQAYERLSPPLSPDFPAFARLSQPFNIMQMTRDREAARVLMEDVMGFDRFWYGPPHVDAEPTVMPLGIPKNLTTSVPYKAGIFYPVAGEFGRMEYIEIDGLDGHDFADRCHAPNLGWLSVTYPVDDLDEVLVRLDETGWPLDVPAYRTTRGTFGALDILSIRSPDGATIEFAAPAAD